MIVVPAQMRRLNARSFLERLQRMETASRAELAKSLGMSQPTAGKIISELLEAGILQEATSALDDRTPLAPRLGRPGQLLHLNSVSDRFIAVEIGIAETRVTALPVACQAEERWAH